MPRGVTRLSMLVIASGRKSGMPMPSRKRCGATGSLGISTIVLAPTGPCIDHLVRGVVLCIPRFMDLTC